MTRSPQDLLLDLHLTFPGIDAHRLPDDVMQNPCPNIWMRAAFLLPDGSPSFVLPDENEGREPAGYTDRIHDAFRAWLRSRGWCAFNHEGPVHFLVPEVDVLFPVGREARADGLQPADGQAS